MKRLEVRLSQRELAAKIGTDQAHISRIERGERTAITVQTLVKLADVLRVSTDYLLGRNATSTSLVEPTIGTGSSQRRKKTKSCP
jgi:transcriptional regulator with XRE-family HTH domain